MLKDKINKILDVIVVIILVYLLVFVYVRLTNIAPGIGEPIPLRFQIASFNNLTIAIGSLAAITVTKLIISQNRTASKVGKGIVLGSIASVYLFALAWSLIFLYAFFYILIIHR